MGGEADGSEVLGGRDPLFVRDDLLPRLYDFGVVTELIHVPIHRPVPATNILHFPVNPAYRRMEIWRRTPLELQFSLLVDLDLVLTPVGTYYDNNLTNDVDYRYYLVARGESDSATPATAEFIGTPKADPLAPEGWIVINSGASMSDSLTVLVELDDSDSPDEVQVSENADFAGALWLPMTDSMNFNLADQGPGAWLATVWVQYRDAAGNVSPAEQTSIYVDPNGDADFDSIINALDPDDDNDGLSDLDELALFGSDPFKIDTDNNGINDFDEDFDRDVYTNGEELALGNDPTHNLADVDGDDDADQDDAVLFAVLFSQGSPLADVNQDRVVDAQDELDFAAALAKALSFVGGTGVPGLQPWSIPLFLLLALLVATGIVSSKQSISIGA
jgi:hypothetical protein